MTYEELQAYLESEKTISGHDDQDILQHFLKKYECVPVKGELMFMLSQGRQFKGNDYLIAFHHRLSGKVPMHICTNLSTAVVVVRYRHEPQRLNSLQRISRFLFGFLNCSYPDPAYPW